MIMGFSSPWDFSLPSTFILSVAHECTGTSAFPRKGTTFLSGAECWAVTNFEKTKLANSWMTWCARRQRCLLVGLALVLVGEHRGWSCNFAWEGSWISRFCSFTNSTRVFKKSWCLIIYMYRVDEVQCGLVLVAILQSHGIVVCSTLNHFAHHYNSLFLRMLHICRSLPVRSHVVSGCWSRVSRWRTTQSHAEGGFLRVIAFARATLDCTVKWNALIPKTI